MPCYGPLVFFITVSYDVVPSCVQTVYVLRYRSSGVAIRLYRRLFADLVGGYTSPQTTALVFRGRTTLSLGRALLIPT